MRHPLRSFPLASHLQCLLGLSGFSALALEIIYTRLLRYWVGSTAFATAVVLSSYMLGLAAGSLVAGRLLPRLKNLLPIFGVLELSIGLFSLCYPWVVKLFETTYIRIAIRLGLESDATLLGQFVTSVALLLIPTLLMGMSFPIAVRAASGGWEDQPGIAEKLYAANLLGAALGALFSDFVLIPFWGLGTSLLFAAATNALVALWVLALHRGYLLTIPQKTGTEIQTQAPPSPQEGRIVMFVALAGGFLILFQEVVWNHMLGEFLDNSAYGFAIMLFAVIAGLGVGAGLSARYLANRRASEVLPWFCLGAGVSSMLLIPFWDSARVLAAKGTTWSVFVAIALLLFVGLILAPEGKGSAIAAGVILSPPAAILLYNWLNPDGATFWVHHGVDFCISVLFMLGPAIFMGFVFPLALQWWLGLPGRSERSVALAYGANSVGSLLGIVAATFLILPRVGVEISARGVAMAFFTLGVWLFVRQSRQRWAMVVAILPALLWSIWFPRWDFSKTHAALGHRGKMVFAQEDLDGGLTTVLQDIGTKQLYANGLYEAGNDYEVHDQARCALVPLIHASDQGAAMVIGLGSGQTAGIVGLFPFKEITLVDLSPGVVEASRQFFGDLNLGVFNDPRTKVRIEDGRHHLLTHPEKLDLLTIEVSRLWVAGEGDLYTKEFYEVSSSRLTDRGILQQWVPLFNLSQTDTLMILRTIHSVFPYVALYMGKESGMVVASRQPLHVDYTKLKGMDSRPQIQAVLQKLEMPSILSLLGDCVLDSEGLNALLARAPDQRISTDLWPYLEYSNARSYFGGRSAKALRQFLFDAQDFRLIPLDGADAGAEELAKKLAFEERSRLKAMLNSP
jgi:spermidine synthase